MTGATVTTISMQRIVITPFGGGTIAIATILSVLQGITYENRKGEPMRGIRTVTITVSDGLATSIPVVSSVNISMVNDNAPVLQLSAPRAVLIEQAGSIQLPLDINITDADHADEFFLQRATVQITPATADLPVELLSAATAGTGLTSTWNATTGTLTVSGAGTTGTYASVLRTVSYNNAAPEPDLSERGIVFKVFDGAQWSTTQTARVEIRPVNDNAPVVAMSASNPAYTDVDSGHTGIVWARVRTLNGQDAADERLESQVGGGGGTGLFGLQPRDSNPLCQGACNQSGLHQRSLAGVLRQCRRGTEEARLPRHRVCCLGRAL